MSRSLFVLLWGALFVAPSLGGEVGGDGEMTSAPSPVSVAPALPALPAVVQGVPAASGGSGQANPRSPSSDRFRALDELLTAPWIDSQAPGSGKAVAQPGQGPAPVSAGGPVKNDPKKAERKASEPKLGYHSPFPGSVSMAPGREKTDKQVVRTDTVAFQDRKPTDAKLGNTKPADAKPDDTSTGSTSRGPGPLPPAPPPVLSSMPTGESSWFTYLDGKPINVGPHAFEPGPGEAIGPRSETVGRFGWWGGGYNGNPLKVGEYQGLSQSPFWDIDTIQSNNRSTVDLWGSQLNSEAWDLRSSLYSNGFKAGVDFEQFPHLLLHQPPVGGSVSDNVPVVSDDLNLGENYAVRVQRLNVAFSGPLTEHISWKMRVWEFHKFGERQANSMAHCFNTNFAGGTSNNHCHILSQQQKIDWLTMEFEPGLVGKWDGLTLDYTRTMRQFTANDQVVRAPFTQFGGFAGSGGQPTIYPYAIVPNSNFQMDRLKIGYDFSQTLRLYSYLYTGDMQNLDRDIHNTFTGFDIRLIKTTQSGITATAYAKLNDSHSQLPPFLLPEEKADPGQIWHPLSYNRFWTGLDGQWFPFRDAPDVWRGLSIRANYEYHEVSRNWAAYPLDVASGYVKPPTELNDIASGSVFNQPTTRIHQFVLASRMRWDSGVITFARYQMRLTDNPLYGLDPLNGALNTSLPTDDQMVEIGGSWSPLPNLLLSTRAAFETMWHSSSYAHYGESNYPVLCTIWYAPTPKLSISAGYSYFSNWVNQDVTFGYRGVDEPPPAETLRVGYSAQTQVINIGARYAWTENLTLSGGFFWTDGYNVFNVPQSQTGANWSQMPLYSDIRSTSFRYQGGFDYRINKRVGAYFRVNVFDYDDKSQGLGNGISYFFLGGLSGVF